MNNVTYLPEPPTPVPDPSKLPQKPGHYLWYGLDLSYVTVGYAQVTQDTEKHRNYLAGRKAQLQEKKAKVDFYVYQNQEGEWLTIYLDHAHNPCDQDGFPWADGWREFDFDWLIPPLTPEQTEEARQKTLARITDVFRYGKRRASELEERRG